VKFIDEYRDRESAEKLIEQIRRCTTRPWTLMEICGGQTHTLIKSGIDRMLPDPITLVHGPGCPVCVTPLEQIERAQAIARRPEVIFTSFGDMLRVPGSDGDLLQIKANGGDVRIVYSPLDAVKLATQEPGRQIVFFAVGFETTAPANAMAVRQAHELRLDNFSILCAHVLVPPAMHAILAAPHNQVQGFLAAGHVCTVMGTSEYEPIAERYRVPIVVTGFEPIDLLLGIRSTIEMLQAGNSGVVNLYPRAVRPEGNPHAIELVHSVFETCDRAWRGIGVIPDSGYRLREEFAAFDAARRFEVGNLQVEEPEVCIAGAVMQGTRKPADCPAFGRECTSEHPLGAPMVSSEGACAAYYRYRERP